MSIFKNSNCLVNQDKIRRIAIRIVAKKNPLVDVLKEYGFKSYDFTDMDNDSSETHPSEKSVHRDTGNNLQEIWVEQDEEGNTEYGYMHNAPDKHEHIYFDNLEDLISHIVEEDEERNNKFSSSDNNKKKKLNKPFRTPGGPKKFSVYVKNDTGNVIKVNFGDPNMSIKRDQPGRRKNYRARHHCDSPGPKTKANYWSCKMWSRPSVTSVLKGTKTSEVKESEKMKDDPCWEGYEMIGKKKKNGKEVPNCVPKK